MSRRAIPAGADDYGSDGPRAPEAASEAESPECSTPQSQDVSPMGLSGSRTESAQPEDQGAEDEGTGEEPTVVSRGAGALQSSPEGCSATDTGVSSTGLKQSAADASQSNFNSSKTVILAAVGCEPDYYLTLWNVYQGTALLRFKASGQEVSTVDWYVCPCNVHGRTAQPPQLGN